MYFAHLIGHHDFDSQLELVLHYFVSAFPIILAILLGLAAALYSVRRKRVVASQKIDQD